jgi:GDPmannose 4,6-dehydratase
MPFSNGTIFTTTSYLKRDEFLLNKIANHAKKWRNGEKDALTVGSLSSRRNLLHAVDVAKAIGIIINQPKGDNYVICGDESYLMSSVVKQLYGVAGIETLEFSDNLGNSGLVEQGSIFPVLIIDKTPDGVDTVPINITGETTKLKELGWMQTVSLDDMLRELIEK